MLLSPSSLCSLETIQEKIMAAKFSKAPIKVCVSGAAGNIGYAILPTLASGAVFGADQPIILCMLEITPALTALKGVEMELQDCAFPNLVGMISTDSYETAFTNTDVCILIGGFPRKQGMLRKDLIVANTKIFKGMGEALNKYAKPTTKVLVVANPANTNCRTALNCCSVIPARNFTAMTRLDHNRALGQIAGKVSVDVKDVSNVIIWGNHSSTQYADAAHGFLFKNGSKHSIASAVNDDEYLKGEFIQTIAQRGAAIIAARKSSSACSAANAACDHLRTWLVTGTAPGEMVSMAVCSQGQYGIEKGLIYSFPVTCKNGEFKVVENLKISPFAREKMTVTMDELLQEARDADSIINQSKL